MIELNGRKLHLAKGTTLAIDHEGEMDWSVMAYGNAGGEPLVGVGSTLEMALDALVDIARGVVFLESA